MSHINRECVGGEADQEVWSLKARGRVAHKSLSPGQV